MIQLSVNFAKMPHLTLEMSGASICEAPREYLAGILLGIAGMGMILLSLPLSCSGLPPSLPGQLHTQRPVERGQPGPMLQEENCPRTPRPVLSSSTGSKGLLSTSRSQVLRQAKKFRWFFHSSFLSSLSPFSFPNL